MRISDFAIRITFGEDCLQDVPRYVRDAGPLIALALEECEAVDPTFGHAVAGL